MGQTIAEKILSNRAGKNVYPGEIVIVAPDLIFLHDDSRPHPINLIRDLGEENIARPEQVVIVLDHSPSHTASVAGVHQMIREYADQQGIRLYEIGSGIAHLVLPENGHIRPGALVIGPDSHTCTQGALGAFACGVGSADVAAALLSGQTWLRVPESIAVKVTGNLPRGVYAKDLALFLIGQFGSDGVTYKSVELSGEAIEALDMDGRFTLCNMGIEMGAKAFITQTDNTTLEWLADHHVFDAVAELPDPGASYSEERNFDATAISPQVALPHKVDNVVPIEEAGDIAIQQAVIGTCTNSRISDFRLAARILHNRHVHRKVRFYIIPGSRDVMASIVADGTLQTLLEAGATMGMPGCSGCIGGAHFAVPGNGEQMISAANRNFRGRTGNRSASIYLGSPATVAASAVTGRITDPREYLE